MLKSSSGVSGKLPLAATRVGDGGSRGGGSGGSVGCRGDKTSQWTVVVLMTVI